MKNAFFSMALILSLFILSSFTSETKNLGTLEDPGTSIIVPLDDTFFIPCANDGLGEWVNFTGSFHIVYHSKANNGGGYHVHGHYQPQNAVGVGLTTGNEYRGTGLGRFSFTTNGSASSYNVVDNFNLIGKAGAGSLKLQTRINFQVNANGEVTVDYDIDREKDCN